MTFDGKCVKCGKRRFERDAFGIGMSAASAAGQAWNPDRSPGPLAGSRFPPVHTSPVMEHGEDTSLGRADVHVAAPHFSSHNSHTGPTHRVHVATVGIEYFTGNDLPTFAAAPYRLAIVERGLTFGGDFLFDNVGRCLQGRPEKSRAAGTLPALDTHCRPRAIEPA